jgi:Flp pilus assembly protein TadG
MATQRQLRWSNLLPFRPRDERGQSMVEFAFTVPIIVLLFVAVVAFAFLLYFFVTLNSCAREGARYTIGHPQATQTDIAAYTKSMAGVLNPSKMIVYVEPANPADRSREAQITVRVTYTFDLVHVTIPYLIAPGSFTFSDVPIDVASTMNMD